mmetsp:Transcript_4756/g.7368  ORF Transcript_4756/g.7368 Transcript_4756/m.7368 type:complete len:170 (+) Transcript_4756:82-591(+)
MGSLRENDIHGMVNYKENIVTHRSGVKDWAAGREGDALVLRNPLTDGSSNSQDKRLRTNNLRDVHAGFQSNVRLPSEHIDSSTKRRKKKKMVTISDKGNSLSRLSSRKVVHTTRGGKDSDVASSLNKDKNKNDRSGQTTADGDVSISSNQSKQRPPGMFRRRPAGWKPS